MPMQHLPHLMSQVTHSFISPWIDWLDDCVLFGIVYCLVSTNRPCLTMLLLNTVHAQVAVTTALEHSLP